MHDIRSMTLPELESLVSGMQQPAYRAAQIFSWLHQRDAESFSEMTDLPVTLRHALAETCDFPPFSIVMKMPSRTDRACKYLFAVENNTIIESVLMAHKHGNSLCVSTQAGCRMGCKFCASAIGGLERNLTAGEIAGQVYLAQRDSGKRVDSVVLMGCGEPLDNYDNCLRFFTLINHPKGLNLGIRHITLSTCGLVPQIHTLARLTLPITLAVSLHAPDDELRQMIMPIARKYNITETVQAAADYAAATRRRVTYEYALIGGLNDTNAQAHALAGLLKGHLCHVNLLTINSVYADFKPSNRVDAFLRILIKHGIPATFRHSMGSDVNAACGQLRAILKK